MRADRAISILCLLACTAAEIASPPERLSHDRRSRRLRLQTDQNRRRYHHHRGRNFDYGYANPPVFRYDHRRRTDPHTVGVYRTYGTGLVTIPRHGATVSVPNVVPYRNRLHKGTITARVIDSAPAKLMQRARRTCVGCPQNKAVVASRGHDHVILPEPCPSVRWIPISGPHPGSTIREGAHTLVGWMGHRGKMCRYKYEVMVRRCGRFDVEGGTVNCTADDAWGSTCTVTCHDGRNIDGSDVIECRDDLSWSSPPPICRSQIGCALPQTPDDKKIRCQVPNETALVGDILPANTYCQYTMDGRRRVITCIDGYWVIKHRHPEGRRRGGRARKNGSREREDAYWHERNEIPRRRLVRVKPDRMSQSGS